MVTAAIGTAEAARAAAELIEANGWCVGSFAESRRVCVAGAIRATVAAAEAGTRTLTTGGDDCGSLEHPTVEAAAVERAFADYLVRVYGIVPGDYGLDEYDIAAATPVLAVFNDDIAHGCGEVISALSNFAAEVAPHGAYRRAGCTSARAGGAGGAHRRAVSPAWPRKTERASGVPWERRAVPRSSCWRR